MSDVYVGLAGANAKDRWNMRALAIGISLLFIFVLFF